MIKLKNSFILFLLITGIVFGCSESPLPEPEPDVEQEPDEEKEEAPELTKKINSFFKDVMQDIYLWYKEVPDIDIRYEFDSKAYFKKLLYKDDTWSYVTDDIKALLDSFEGEETSFGYSLAFGQFSDTKDIFALVEFVYPNTPASEAGIKRGDFISKMNNANITLDNYLDLLYAKDISVTFGQYSETIGIHNLSTIFLTAEELSLNPVLVTDIVEHEGRRIGYLFYAQYISSYNYSIDTAFQYFLDKGITDLVLDLRYNPGGYTSAAQYLCSVIAPLNVVNAKETLVTLRWNDWWQGYWEMRNNTSQLKITFVDTTRVKMGLNKMYVLTGTGTASASELTITGLKPYMDLVTVGEKTYGKYTGSITLQPEDLYEESYYRDFDNWGVQPIVIRYANSLGVTDFKDGFLPDIPAEDDLFSGIPLGDKQDPLLKAAIEDITGTPVIAMKKAKVKIPYTIFDRGFSQFDHNKREMIIDHLDITPLIK